MWHERLQLTAETLDKWYVPFKDKKGIWVEGTGKQFILSVDFNL